MKKTALQILTVLLTTTGIAQNQIENLGSKVNSKFSEIRPTISADGKTLFYVVEGNPQNVNYKNDKKAQDVWFVNKVDDTSWSQPVHCPAPINGSKDNAVFWVAPDGNRLLLRGAYENGKFLGRGISLCNRTAGGWSQPQQLKINGYNKMAVDNYAGASLSNDGKTLLLYFSEEKNSSLNDLYMSHLEDDGSWSRPVKMGNVINLDDYDEISPFLASDNLTLYFASDRPGGKGGYDIWMSKRLDDSWMVWTEPVNMGDAVNSPDWEAYFTIDAKGDYGYLATSKSSFGGTDIVRLKLSQTQRPQTVTLLFGKVYNASTGKPMDAKLHYDLVPGETAEGNAVAFVDGTYKLTLPYGKKYSIRASADNYFSVIDTIDLSAYESYRELRRDLYLQPTINDGKVLRDANGNIVRTSIDSIFKKGAGGADASTIEFGRVKEYLLNHPDQLTELVAKENPGIDQAALKLEIQRLTKELADQKIAYQNWLASGGTKEASDLVVDNEKIKEGLILTTNNILFDFGKSIIRSESYSELNKAAIMMKANPKMQIELSAHTDAVGGYSKNLKLSNDRAQAAKEYLLSKGIEADRIIAKGYGETTPVGSNQTAEGRQMNRRVEFRILKK